MKNLLQNFKLEDGVYFQEGVSRNNDFEKKYYSIREKENRIYTDQQVSEIPGVDSTHTHYKEWQIRKESLDRLLKYISKRNRVSILDLGCGNGWMSNKLAHTNADVIAMDINEFELKQGSRVFREIKNLQFVYADILSKPFQEEKIFDLIILSSSIQYFENLHVVIRTLLKLLLDTGEIHILDSPFYDKSQLSAARQRTIDHYEKLGFNDQAEHYFHHSWRELLPFNYKVFYNPDSFMGRIGKLFNDHASPFPWICIRK